MGTQARSASESSRRRPAVPVIALLAAALLASVARAAVPATTPEPVGALHRAPPPLERHAVAMRDGFAALAGGDHRRAATILSAFSYDERPVEQARLYALARAQELAGETTEARRTLSRLRAGGGEFASRGEMLLKLAAIFADGGFWRETAEAFAELRGGVGREDGAGRAALAEMTARLALGDPGALLARSRELAADRPTAGSAGAGLSIARSLTGESSALDALTTSQRARRAWKIAEAGDGERALAELATIDPAPAARERDEIAVTRALALRAAGRLDESTRALNAASPDEEPLRTRALELAAANARTRLAAVESASWRTWTVKEKAGTRRVKVKGRWTTKTLYRSVTKKAKKTDARTRRQLAAARHEAEAALARLLDAEQPSSEKKATLRALATLAREGGDREALERRLVELVMLDRREDHLLQDEWNDAWAAWKQRKLALARERFGFIQRVYYVPAARRQARYWYARCLEATGEPGEARRIYGELASARLDDVYASFARARGGRAVAVPDALPPLTLIGDEPPAELALARELAAIGLGGEARAEVRAAQNDGNRRWAYAILAESHAIDGSQLLMANALRRGFPEIGTVDDDLVPERYRRMYYEPPHRELLERAAARRELDPALVMGLVLQESSGDAAAGSKAGAIGLMQLMPSTAAEVSRKAGLSYHADRLTEPDFNVELGTRYLRELLGLTRGDEILALASYNAGLGNVQRWLRASRGAPDDEFLESIPYAETRGYVKRVLYYRSVYREGAPGG